MVDIQLVGRRVRALRVKAGWTQKQLARYAGGMSSAHLSAFETGRVALSLEVLGHVARASIGQNSVTAPDSLRTESVAPHFGICQFGWRGPLLTLCENNVAGMDNGIAVIPGLVDAAQGIWRLRDNAVFRTRRAYVTAPGVEVT